MNTDLIKQALSVIASRWLLNLCNFATFVLLARLLTSHDFGVYGIFTSTVFLVESTGHLGLRQASAHQVGQKHLSDRQAMGASLLLWPVMGTVCGLLVWWAMRGPVPEGELPAWLLPALLASFAVIMTAICQGIFLGRGQIRYFSLAEVLPRAIVLLGILAMWALDLVSVEEQAWLFALAFALTAIACAVLARPVEGGERGRYLASLRQLVRRGWPFALGVFLTMVNSRVSLFILSDRVDPAASGQYFAALRLNELILQSAASVGLVLFSHGARTADPREALLQAAHVTRWLTWATVLLTVLGIALTPILVPLLLGERYQPTVMVLQILNLALPFATLSKVLSPTLSGLGRPLLAAVVTAPNVLLHAVFCYFLVGQFGVAGAGAAMAIAQLTAASALVVVTGRTFGVPVRTFIVPQRKDVADIRDAVLQRVRRRVKHSNPPA